MDNSWYKNRKKKRSKLKVGALADEAATAAVTAGRPTVAMDSVAVVAEAAEVAKKSVTVKPPSLDPSQKKRRRRIWMRQQ